MIYLEISKHIGNKFALTILAAKRARQIIDERSTNEESPINAVSIALEEIADGKVKFSKTGKSKRLKNISDN